MVSDGDRLAIQELLSRHFYALDGLTQLVPGNAARNWAETFTENGTFRLERANGDVVAEVSTRGKLEALFSQFTAIETTRHWTNGQIIEPVSTTEVSGGCYIIALDIGQNPSPITRSGQYRDRIVKTAAGWKFDRRTLTLDPSSPAG
jgi:hypothetical protein